MWAHICASSPRLPIFPFFSFSPFSSISTTTLLPLPSLSLHFPIHIIQSNLPSMSPPSALAPKSSSMPAGANFSAATNNVTSSEAGLAFFFFFFSFFQITYFHIFLLSLFSPQLIRFSLSLSLSLHLSSFFFSSLLLPSFILIPTTSIPSVHLAPHTLKLCNIKEKKILIKARTSNSSDKQQK